MAKEWRRRVGYIHPTLRDRMEAGEIISRLAVFFFGIESVCVSQMRRKGCEGMREESAALDSVDGMDPLADAVITGV